MKKTFLFLVSVFLLSVAQSVFALDKIYIVKITDHLGNHEVGVFSDEDYKKLQDEMRKESRVFSKALRAAKEEWADGGQKKSFPGGLNQRKISSLGVVTSEEKAAEKLEFYKQKYEPKESGPKVSKVLTRQLEEEKLQLENLTSGGYQISGRDRGTIIRRRRDNIASLEREIKRQEDKYKDKDDSSAEGLAILESKIAELMPE